MTFCAQMLLSDFSCLGGGGPEGHFLAAALPNGFLRWQLLRALDREPRTGSAPSCSWAAHCGKGRRGLRGRRGLALQCNTGQDYRPVAAPGNAPGPGGTCRQGGLLTGNVTSGAAGAVRAPHSGRALRELQLRR